MRLCPGVGTSAAFASASAALSPFPESVFGSPDESETDLRFGACCFGFGVWCLVFWFCYIGFAVLGLLFWVRCFGFGVWCLVFGVWGLVFGVWCLVFGVWSLEVGFGVWCLVFGVWGVECDGWVRNLGCGFGGGKLGGGGDWTMWAAFACRPASARTTYHQFSKCQNRNVYRGASRPRPMPTRGPQA